MQRIKQVLLSDTCTGFVTVFLISGLIYLPFISQFGYYKDDWYLMYAAGAYGPSVFHQIFAIDRPLRALVMIPAYSLFGANPLYYNLSSYFFRLAGALGFLWTISLLWPRQRLANLSAALLFLVYPGFLSQPNAIDYQSHMAGLAAGMLSIALTLRAVLSERVFQKAVCFLFAVLLGWFYLGQIEWYIGLEIFRWACIFFLFLQERIGFWKAAVKSLLRGYPALLIAGGFLCWRLYFFESERGATDVELQFDQVLSSPFTSLWNWLGTLLNDTVDSVFYAWVTPLRRLSSALSSAEWLPGLVIALFILIVYGVFQWKQQPSDDRRAEPPNWRWHAIVLGIILLIFGLLPVILVGRSVDFKNFSRYTLIASAGVALIWQAALSFMPNILLQRILFGILLVSASLTHYVNAAAHIHETEALQNFWWQVSWRIPQMKQGTTLIANYPTVAIEEDYFVWGPASLLYYPDSMHADYPQPGLYSVVITDETTERIFTREGQDFSNRRGIRTYPNYRNVLILTQPSADSCVHVIDGSQPELSPFEEDRVKKIAPFSKIERVLVDGEFHRPPQIPFGEEPEQSWCYYYEKADYARQAGDWTEVLRLSEQALDKDFSPKDEIEWIPFLQAYAISNNLTRLRELEASLADASVRDQACGTLQSMDGLSLETQTEVQKLFCDK